MYTPHMPLKPHILCLKHDNTQCKIYHSMPFILIQLISLPHRTYKRPYKHISNGPFTHLFLLIICEITTHTPLKYRILYQKHDNTQCKFYHSMPLHTYTANFAPSSNLQEILSNSPFIQHFLLIICEIIV